MSDKTSVPKFLLAILMAFLMLFTATPLTTLAADKCTKPPCTYGYTPPVSGAPQPPTSFSTPVAQSEQSVSTAVQIQYYSTNNITAENLSSLATATQTFFAEMNTTGYTASLQTWILNNPSLFETTPTASELQTAYNYMSLNKAIVVPESVWSNQLLNVPLTARQTFYSQVQTYGLEYVNEQIVGILNLAAADALRIGNGHLIYANKLWQCEGAPPWLTIGGLYLGIAALAISGPVGWAVAAAGIALGGTGLLTGC